MDSRYEMDRPKIMRATSKSTTPRNNQRLTRRVMERNIRMLAAIPAPTAGAVRTAGLTMVATWLNDEFSATIFWSAAWGTGWG